MAKFPRFASPVPREWRAYYRAIQEWFERGTGPAAERPEDPLRPFRDASKGKSRRKLISLRLDHHLLELTKEVARQHDLRYQAVIRLWIEEGLRRAIREGVDGTQGRSPVP
jgi:uncharacterized protein (DUF4415 family)